MEHEHTGSACGELNAGYLHLIRVAASLERLIERALQQEVGITLVQFEVLLHLVESPGRSLPINYIDTALTSGGMTRLIDRMAKAGLVVRCREPRDRRVQLVQPTEEGLSVYARAAAVNTRIIERYFVAPLTTSELAELTQSLGRLAAIATEAI